jgi:hypothetical protein
MISTRGFVIEKTPGSGGTNFDMLVELAIGWEAQGLKVLCLLRPRNGPIGLAAGSFANKEAFASFVFDHTDLSAFHVTVHTEAGVVLVEPVSNKAVLGGITASDGDRAVADCSTCDDFFSLGSSWRDYTVSARGVIGREP